MNCFREWQLNIENYTQLLTTQLYSELQELHREVQDHLSEFYQLRSAQRKADEHRTLLLSQLNRDCELLLSAPPVSATSSSDVTTHSSRSASIARMAEMAHQEELKAMVEETLDEISLSQCFLSLLHLPIRFEYYSLTYNTDVS